MPVRRKASLENYSAAVHQRNQAHNSLKTNLKYLKRIQQKQEKQKCKKSLRPSKRKNSQKLPSQLVNKQLRQGMIQEDQLFRLNSDPIEKSFENQ